MKWRIERLEYDVIEAPNEKEAMAEFHRNVTLRVTNFKITVTPITEKTVKNNE